MDNYQAVRSNLIRERDDIEHRLKKIKEDIRHSKNPLNANLDEQAVERENDEVLDILDVALHDKVDMIHKALSRIDEGKYEICTLCGNTIPSERLEALPYTDRCVSCASQYES